MSGLRVMIYDRTCTGRRMAPGLSHAWRAGAIVYGSLRRLDHWHGVQSWPDALDWLAQVGAGPIDEIQVWGHGRWGKVLIEGASLDKSCLAPDHALYGALERVRDRLHGDSLVWLRTCEAFATMRGHEFARALTAFLGCRVAGHTYRIGSMQSGLHVLSPGEIPSWPRNEGVVTDEDDQPVASLGSRPWLANTITCLHGAVPRDSKR